MRNPVFAVENLTFGYHPARVVLDDITFEVGKGEILAILGPNGAGKTTLLKCLLGMLIPNSGDCSLYGKMIRSYGRSLWTQIAYVPQAKSYALSYRTEHMILLGRGAHIQLTKQPTAEDVGRVKNMMQRLEIGHLEGRTCGEISGGELQMVLLARALVAEPSVLVLDEPESNLDYQNQMKVLKVLEECAENGITCIFNTHYPEHALRAANQSLLLKDGRVYRYGDSRMVLQEQNFEEVYGVRANIVCVEHNGISHYGVIPTEIVNDFEWKKHET